MNDNYTRKYHYPFEVCRKTDKAFLKSDITEDLEEYTCCSCNEVLTVCKCPSTVEEDEERRLDFFKEQEKRDKFWEGYFTNTDEGKEKIASIKRHMTKMDEFWTSPEGEEYRSLRFKGMNEMPVYMEDLTNTVEKNKRTLSSCRKISESQRIPGLQQHINRLEGILAELEDPSNISPGGTVVARGAKCMTLEQVCGKIFAVACRKINCKVGLPVDT